MVIRGLTKSNAKNENKSGKFPPEQLQSFKSALGAHWTSSINHVNRELETPWPSSQTIRMIWPGPGVIWKATGWKTLEAAKKWISKCSLSKL